MEKSSFFNAEISNGEYDRVYLAEDYARYFSSFVGNGVFPNPSSNLKVSAEGNSMKVIVAAGKAWINGYYYENDSDLLVALDPADGVLHRIDRIVLRLDFLEREISIKVRKGTFSSTPVAADIERSVDAYELAIADVRINNGIISIVNSNINDLRLNKNLCGLAHGIIEQVDTTEIFNTYQEYLNEKLTGGEFTEWFDGLKEKLNPYEDVALQLQLQIEGLETKYTTIEGNIAHIEKSIGDIEESVGENLSGQLEGKADKNGTLQTNLNADMIDGLHADKIARYYKGSNSVNIADTNLKEFYGTCVTQNSSAPNTDWWHVINVPHSDSNGYGGQLAIGYHGNAHAYVRSASGTSWGAWSKILTQADKDELFQYANNGKTAIANAVIGKNVNANSSMTFQQLAAAINNITVQKDIHKQPHWMEIPSMYLPAYGVGSGAYGGDENNWYQEGNTVWFFRNGYYNVYDIANKKWVSNKSYSGGCAKAGNFVYGLAGGTYPKFHTYNLVDGTTTSVECKYTSYKSTGTRVATNTGIHVLGGSTGTSVANKVLSHQKIIFGTGAIASRSSLPEKNSGPTACADEYYNIYCIGGSGYDGNKTYAVNKFGRFSEATNTWTYFSTDKGVTFGSMSCRNNIVYLFYEDTITMYNIATGTWSVKSTKKGIKSWGSTMFIVNGILHITGGEYGLVGDEAVSQVTWAFVE